MTSISKHLYRSKRFWAAFFFVIAGSIATLSLVQSTTSPPNIPAINLSAAPLYALANTDKAALTLALSVEFPTAGAQYTQNSGLDNTYANTTEYIGYYDAESCYSYNDAPTDMASGQTQADYKRFSRIGAATNRMCDNAFSGNFLNWASSSAVDMIRMALTGGDRSVDTANLTLLQRAFVSNGDPRCLWNTTEFPAKQLRKDGGGAGNYWGAVPTLMKTTAGSSDIWIANILNRIYFRAGSASVGAGDCTSTSTNAYKLGAPGTTPQTGPVTQPYMAATTAFNTFYPKCGADNETCTFSGIKEVLYGNANGGSGNWVIFPASNGNSICYDLANRTVDPLSGILKQCYTRPYTGSWTPTVGGPSQQYGTVTNPYMTASTAMTSFYPKCADDYGVCEFTGIMEVLYGNAAGGWIVYPAQAGTVGTTGKVGVTCLPPSGATDPASGIQKQCYLRPYTGTWRPSNQLNSDGFFYGRVAVCDKDANGNLLDNRDYGLCKKYPAGNFKPAGAIQKYSEQLRLAVFGYLMDNRLSGDGQSSARYGGVLRAAMKYVGAKTFDTNGGDNTPQAGNPNMEWNASTGIFVADPDSAANASPAFATSGVINYLNKFGRIGPIPGRHKIYDPVGELHNETLRYLQGLQPSTAAVSGITSDMYDGFPVYTTWTDPYAGRSADRNYTCTRSSIVVVGDRVTWDSNTLRDRTANLTQNIPDIAAATNVAINFEKNLAGTYADGQGVTRQIANPNTPNNNIALYSQSQIIGSAYWARTNDIRGTNWTAQPTLQRPGLRVKTIMFDVNYNGESNVDTFRRTQNQLFTAAKYGGFNTDAATSPVFHNYGNPFKRQDGTNDNNVWQDPTSPGDALSYYRQNNARAVLTAFDKIFSSATQSGRSIAGRAVVSKNITAGSTLFYQSSFDTSSWSGDVLAFSVSLSTENSNTIAVGVNPTWSASTRLGALSAPATSRNIIVGNSGATSTLAASAFTWAAIEQSLKDKLNKPSQASVADNLGQDRLNYLRGDKSKEGVFRVRTSLLGDVINSGVIYQGAPVAPAGATSGFAAFRTTNATRTPAVFVGANDGMMHAFNANTGDELFAYIPSSMGDKLSLLTGLSYNNNHQSYVDASPVVAEAKVGNGDTANDWKSVLVSGTGGGAPGVFALNVTNPSSFSASNVLWEFTKADDADMGFVVGRPHILKLRTSQPGTTPATFRYFAAVASGVNNYVSYNNSFSTHGKPALFLLALDKQPGTAWVSSSNYYKILLPTDTTLSATNPTGLINIRPTVGANGETQKIYMGDLHGKLWKIDFTKTSLAGPGDWNMEKLTAYNKGTIANPVPYPLFIAKTAGDDVQPITMAPLLAAGPVADGIETAIVGFGTGKYLETSDNTSTRQNTFYAVYDNGLSGADSSPAGNSIINGRGRLQAGTVNTSTFTVNVPSFQFGRPSANTSANLPPTKAGFYFDLPSSGERIINDGSVNGNYFLVQSLFPVPSESESACGASQGGGNSYRINIDTGNASYQRSTVGVLSSSLDFLTSTTLSPTLSTGKSKRTVVTNELTIGSNGASPSIVSTTQTYDVGRMSWRQINNYKDLFNAPVTP